MARPDTHGAALLIRSSQKNSSAAHIPKIILQNPELLLGSRLLYGVLYGYVYGTGRPIPNHATLSRDLGVSPRTIRTLIADLQRCGLLRVTRVGARKPNRYELKFIA